MKSAGSLESAKAILGKCLNQFKFNFFSNRHPTSSQHFSPLLTMLEVVYRRSQHFVKHSIQQMLCERCANGRRVYMGRNRASRAKSNSSYLTVLKSSQVLHNSIMHSKVLFPFHKIVNLGNLQPKLGENSQIKKKHSMAVLAPVQLSRCFLVCLLLINSYRQKQSK